MTIAEDPSEEVESHQSPTDAVPSARRSRRARGRFGSSTQWWEALRKVAIIVAVAAAGAVLGWTLAPATSTTIGPLEVAVRASITSQAPTVVELPPIGDVSFASHTGPLGFDISVRSIDLKAAQRLLDSRTPLAGLTDDAAAAARRAVITAVAVSVGCAMLGAALMGLLVYRRPRRAAQCAVVPLVPAVLAAVVAASTFQPTALSEPKFSGLLSRAPYIANQTLTSADRYEAYRSGVADLTRAVSTLYATANQLPVLTPTPSGTTTILHVSDIHLNPQAFDLIANLVRQFKVSAVLDTGDITTWGTALESNTLAPIGKLGVPYVFVRGNHDSAQTAAAVKAQRGAVVLDNSVTEVAGLRIAGIADPVFTPDGIGTTNSRELNRAASSTLAATINASARDGEPVDIAMDHDPTEIAPLVGTVPLVLCGHMHTRSVRVYAGGTRLMVEGSTGGAGFAADALVKVEKGDPVPLNATLLYFTAGADGRKQLAAYDEVTVGGLGLASVSVERTVIRADDQPDDEPLPDVTPQDRTPTESETAAPATTTPSTPSTP